MKATITIEIEGDSNEINTVTKNLQSFMKRQPGSHNIKPRFTPEFNINKRPKEWWK